MKPIKAVAAGDSWLVHLPFHLGTGGGLANALFGDIMHIPFTNLAHAGDSSEESMGTAMATKLEAALPGADVLLWSSGGDDFAGDEFEIFIDQNDGRDPSLAINMDRFQKALDVTMMDYDRLVELRDRIAPNCLIVCHAYDYPPASQIGNGFLTFGPWLQPGLKRRGWNDPQDQAEAVKAALDALAKRLYDTKDIPGLGVVNVHLLAQDVKDGYRFIARWIPGIFNKQLIMGWVGVDFERGWGANVFYGQQGVVVIAPCGVCDCPDVREPTGWASVQGVGIGCNEGCNYLETGACIQRKS